MTRPVTDHPARFSPQILAAIRRYVETEAMLLGRPVRVLDPYAGVGRIHELAGPEAETTGVEIEPEWAACHERTRVGDSTQLARLFRGRISRGRLFDVIATSPDYGNRMADHHDAKDPCSQCKGLGHLGVVSTTHGQICPKCKGRGTSPRKSYRYALGRPLAENNGARRQWGDSYRELHQRVVAQWPKVLPLDGLVLVNMSDHPRGKKMQPVVRWWFDTIEAAGFHVERVDPIVTRRMKHGANRERAPHEHLIVARRTR